MRFAFTDDQLLFRDAVREVLAKECSPDVVRHAWESGSAHSVELWRALAELGVVGLTVPETDGGLGMKELDLVLLLEESGRAALPEPLLGTTAVAVPLLVESGHPVAGEWLPAIAGGDAIIAVALGRDLVLDVDVAAALVAYRDERVVLVPAGALDVVRQPSIDGSRHLFSVDWDDANATVLASEIEAQGLVQRALDRGALGAAAQLVGLAEQMLTVTVDYVRQREQFGVAIGSFQAVKHHLADALLAIEFAKPVAYRAAYEMTESPKDASVAVSMAKSSASDAATLVARKALQCHGAIAYTVEYDLHMWMKRAWALAAAWGDARWHRRRVAASVLGPDPAH
jgi:alkylation response protein AidB-like acyl-CoA dehydrogenase